jgi:putative nucleotidyltransferase with HDIG domain
MGTDLFRRILNEHKELSSLPQTLAEVLRVAKDENSSAQDLAKILRRDPALTAKILRVVNSPFYGAGREIHSVSQAVVTMGMRGVTALALSTSIYDMTNRWQCSVDRIRFWRHSLAVAAAAKIIGEAVKYPSVEEAFVSGLLHDVGILILEKSFPEEYHRIWQQTESGAILCELEEKTWSTNHARVGQFLFEQWNLPAAICQAVGQHHNQFALKTAPCDQQLTQIVALANMVCQFRLVQSGSLSAEELKKKETIMANLNLKQDRIKQIEQNHLSQVMEEAKFLEIDIGSPHDILIEANRMLYQQYLMVENLLRENRQMQEQLVSAKMDKASLEALKTITATFHHYINNAVATILGRAQLVEVALQRGHIVDPGGSAALSMQVIINGVATIRSVMEELTKLTTFKTTIYHDNTYIIDIENTLKEKLGTLEKASPPA